MLQQPTFEVLHFCLSASCVEERTGDSCLHEYHLFGTNDHTASSVKLGVLLVMFILNVSNIKINNFSKPLECTTQE